MHLASPPMFAFLWVLVVFSVSALLFLSLLQVPQFVAGEGMIIQQTMADKPAQQETIVLLLLPAGQPTPLRQGQQVSLRLTPAAMSGGGGPFTLGCVVESSASESMSPDQITTRFHLPPPLAPLVSQPAEVVTARILSSTKADLYLWSQGQAQIQVGSRRAFWLVPGADRLRPIASALASLINHLGGNAHHGED